MAEHQRSFIRTWRVPFGCFRCLRTRVTPACGCGGIGRPPRARAVHAGPGPARRRRVPGRRLLPLTAATVAQLELATQAGERAAEIGAGTPRRSRSPGGRAAASARIVHAPATRRARATGSRSIPRAPRRAAASRRDRSPRSPPAPPRRAEFEHERWVLNVSGVGEDLVPEPHGDVHTIFVVVDDAFSPGKLPQESQPALCTEDEDGGRQSVGRDPVGCDTDRE